MNPIKVQFNFKTTKSRRTEKGDLLDEFLLNLNKERVRTKYKLLTFPYLVKTFKQRKMDNHVVYCLLQECKQAQHFSKYYFWAIKNKYKIKPCKD